MKTNKIKKLTEIKGIQDEIIGFFEDVFSFWKENVYETIKEEYRWPDRILSKKREVIDNYKKKAINFASMVQFRKEGNYPEENLEGSHKVSHFLINDMIQEAKSSGFKLSTNEHFKKILEVYEDNYYDMKWEKEHGLFDVPGHKNSHYSHNYCINIEYDTNAKEYEVIVSLLYKCFEAPYQVDFCTSTPAEKRMGIFPDVFFPTYE